MKWKLALLLTLGFTTSSAWSLNLSDLLTQTRIFIRDTATDPSRQRFTDSQLTSFLNNGQKEVNLRTWALVNSTSISILAGTTEYSLPSDEIMILRVTLGNVPLSERTFSFLDESNSSWISDTGIPAEYYIRTDSSVVSGVSRECIGVHPISTFTSVMVVQYLAQPADLSSNSDIPFSGQLRMYPFHQLLAYYASYRGFAAISNIDDAAVYYREYMEMVSVLEGMTKNRMVFNPNFRGSPIPMQSASDPASQGAAK